jgi:NAD(P)-dependent dehydrogenase (short-subunit alcohol dehydrogenase family)
MSFSIAHRSAIVTGGCSGIGLAMVLRFLAHGARVMVLDRRADDAAVVEAAGALFMQGDVSVEKDIEAAFH